MVTTIHKHKNRRITVTVTARVEDEIILKYCKTGNINEQDLQTLAALIRSARTKLGTDWGTVSKNLHWRLTGKSRK